MSGNAREHMSELDFFSAPAEQQRAREQAAKARKKKKRGSSDESDSDHDMGRKSKKEQKHREGREGRAHKHKARSSSRASDQMSDGVDDVFKTSTKPAVVWSEKGAGVPQTAQTWEDYSRFGGNTTFLAREDAEDVTARMDRCKREHRSSLELTDWQRYGYAETFDHTAHKWTALVDKLAAAGANAGAAEGRRAICSWIWHIHTKDYDCGRFLAEFEQPCRPVVIAGCADHWTGRSKWTLPALATGEYRNSRLKCGEDDDGYSIKVRLKYFMQYLLTQRDDSPLYVFDSSYDEHSVAKGILQDYDLPVYFRADLFRLVGEKRRPPYRWFLVGPKRSGSSLHIDPLATSAWNTLITGKKLWVLFDPSSPKKLCKGEHLKQRGEDNEAITYFTRILPRIMAEEEKKADGPSLGMRLFIQYPGQTVFIPGGWWHAVLNLEDTTAVTQNFCSEHNFPMVWRKTRKGRKHMARRWLEELRTQYPHLYEQAIRIDKEDDWEWVFSDRKKKKKKKKKKRSSSKSSSKENKKRRDSR